MVGGVAGCSQVVEIVVRAHMAAAADLVLAMVLVEVTTAVPVVDCLAVAMVALMAVCWVGNTEPVHKAMATVLQVLVGCQGVATPAGLEESTERAPWATAVMEGGGRGVEEGAATKAMGEVRSKHCSLCTPQTLRTLLPNPFHDPHTTNHTALMGHLEGNVGAVASKVVRARHRGQRRVVKSGQAWSGR